MKAGNSKQRPQWRQSINRTAWPRLACIWTLAMTSVNATDAAENAEGAPAREAREDRPEQRAVFFDSPVVLSVSGRVETQFAGELVAVPPLASLKGVERVILSTGAALRGVCPDLTAFEVKETGDRGIPCLPPPRVQPSYMAPMRYVVDPTIPRLLSPRTGFIRRRPVIRWSSVPGVSRYRLELRDETFVVRWRHTVQGSQLAYPASAPAMLPGQIYSFRVATEQRSSDEDNTDQVFQVMSAEGRKRVQAAEQRLTAMNLKPDARRHVWTQVLMGFELYAEAFEVLRSGKGNPTAQSFGQLLLRMGLHAHARTVLRSALKDVDEDLTDVQVRQLLAQLGDDQYSVSGERR